MRRSELEHLIRAAAQIVDDPEIVVLGSQSILGQFPDAPAELLFSREADLFPKNRIERAILISGALGELGMFHETYGYYADGVGPETAVLPPGWEDRVVLIKNDNTCGAVGLCLEIHDLLVSKLAAGRPKDFDFARIALRAGLAAKDVLLARAKAVQDDPSRSDDVKTVLANSTIRIGNK